MKRQPIITTAGLLMALLFAIPSAGADTHDRLTSAADTVQALVKIPEAEQGIPQDLDQEGSVHCRRALAEVGGARRRRRVWAGVRCVPSGFGLDRAGRGEG